MNESMKCFFFYEFFRLCWVFVAALRLSLVLESGGCSCCGAQASHGDGVSCCGAWALGALASVGATQTLVSCGSWALGHAAFSTCGSRALEHGLSSSSTCAWLPRSTRDLPRPGIEPALAGGFSSTAPPGKSESVKFL